MKRNIAWGILLAALAASSAFAQDIYFDGGLEVGMRTLKIDGVDNGTDSDVGLGLKIGYGPMTEDLPLYVVGMITTGEDSTRWTMGELSINARAPYFFGAGVLFYPIPLIQVGASVGYSYGYLTSSIVSYDPTGSVDGYGFDASIALDFGDDTKGCLIGFKYFYTANSVSWDNAPSNATHSYGYTNSHFRAFVKFAYRERTSYESLFRLYTKYLP
jgi:hypothetical protein